MNKKRLKPKSVDNGNLGLNSNFSSLRVLS
jgi:hypothetical protein